jgi:hypothetical protein
MAPYTPEASPDEHSSPPFWEERSPVSLEFAESMRTESNPGTGFL